MQDRACGWGGGGARKGGVAGLFVIGDASKAVWAGGHARSCCALPLPAQLLRQADTLTPRSSRGAIQTADADNEDRIWA